MKVSGKTNKLTLVLTPLWEQRALIGIIILSVIARVIAAVYLGNQVEILPGTHDQVSYHTLALRVLNGHGFTFGEPWWPLTDANAPTAHWSFLYTFYLIAVYGIFGPNPMVARIIQAIIVGFLQPYLAYKIGKTIFNSLIGIIAAGITALYIYIIYYAANLMTEAFYISAILSSLYLAIVFSTRHREKKLLFALLLGLVVAATVLLRQLYLLFVPFLFLWIWWSGRKNAQKSMVPMLLVSGIVIIASIIPFSIYNYMRFDRFVLLNTNAGYAFYWGNHPIYGTHFESILPPEMGSYLDLIPPELYDLDEAALDQELMQEALQIITDDPWRYIQLSISRIPEYFKFWPSPESGTLSNLSRVLSFGLAWPFMLYGLIRVPFWKNLKYKFQLESPYALLYLFAFIYTGIHLLTWALIRYRLPVDAVLIIFAAIPFYELIQYLYLHRLKNEPEYQTVG